LYTIYEPSKNHPLQAYKFRKAGLTSAPRPPFSTMTENCSAIKSEIFAKKAKKSSGRFTGGA
jgi:hypothetical protein